MALLSLVRITLRILISVVDITGIGSLQISTAEILVARISLEDKRLRKSTNRGIDVNRRQKRKKTQQ